jgi:predicted O-methyltransferase YrrM
MSIFGDSRVEALVTSLHAESDAQAIEMQNFESRRACGDRSPTDAEIKAFRADKLVALDRDKAEFCYHTCRAIDARRVVEVGTSCGVSTLYLAAAVRDNIAASGGEGIVIGTEYEPVKARAAKANITAAGLSQFVELREGDLRDTLKSLDGDIDFVLVDIWVAMARLALELVVPHLRRRAVVICDNTAQHRSAYAPYFDFLTNPANRFRTMTLPFSGGLEFSVRC